MLGLLRNINIRNNRRKIMKSIYHCRLYKLPYHLPEAKESPLELKSLKWKYLYLTLTTIDLLSNSQQRLLYFHFVRILSFTLRCSIHLILFDIIIGVPLYFGLFVPENLRSNRIIIGVTYLQNCLPL